MATSVSMHGREGGGAHASFVTVDYGNISAGVKLRAKVGLYRLGAFRRGEAFEANERAARAVRASVTFFIALIANTHNCLL